VYEEDWTNAQLFVADLDVTGAKPRAVNVKGHPSDLDWSADGRHLLLALAPDPLVDSSYMRKRLNMIDSQTGEVVAQVDHSGKLGRSTVSPGGKLVGFVAAADEHDPQAGRLTVASAFGGVTRELLPDFAGHFVTCAFASDESLVYLADRGCETVLGRISAEGTANEELLAQPGLVVTSLSLARNGKRAALVAHTATHPPEVYAWDVHAKATRLTDSNPWLAQRTFGAQEVFTFKARDGLELEGVLIKPLDGTTASPHPLVVIVHGGPESHFRNGWLTRYSEPGQILAAKGYAVFFPNYRASTGRGVAFSQLDHKDPAGKEFDDLVDGVDALAAGGLIDPKKVGITGGSYGGYASAWCATKYSDRFAAAVMGFGVSNLLSMIGTSDIPDEHFLVHHRMHPWEDWQLFLERSPIFHAPQCKTPILILAGKADPRVPPSQSIEMYRYLKILDHPSVRLVLYPGEGHGNARAASRLDYHLRLLQWFDHYLTGPGGAPPADELDAKSMLETKPAAPSATGS
jgi:dipeptidyl aminopeptidase/acylaminoacyl peptidase